MYDDEQKPFKSDDFGDDVFADNPEPRCPVALILDGSGSMRGEAIAQLNAGLKQFCVELRRDTLAAKRIELSITTFEPLETIMPFSTVDLVDPPHLVASGGTPIGSAIVKALDGIAARKSEYRTAGISYYRPWAMLISDGCPTDDWTAAAARVAEAERRAGLSFFAVGVDQADMATLARISTRAPLHLRGLDFAGLFTWLSNSLANVSRSQIGQAATLSNPTGPTGWATTA